MLVKNFFRRKKTPETPTDTKENLYAEQGKNSSAPTSPAAADVPKIEAGGENEEGSAEYEKFLSKAVYDNVDDYIDIIQEDDDQSRLAANNATEQDLDREIKVLLGPKKHWCRESKEANDFVASMKAVRRIEATDVLERKDLLPPVYLTSDPPLSVSADDGFYCRVNLISNTSKDNASSANMQKTVKCNYNLSADEFADEFAQKIQKSHNMNRERENWVFKATGSSEYLYGHHKLVDFEYIRQCLKKGQNVNLNLMEKDLVLKELDPHDQTLKTITYDYSFKEEQADHLQPSYKKYQQLSFARNRDDEWSPDRSTICLQDVHRPFKIKMNGIDHLILNIAALDKQHKTQIDLSEMSIYAAVEFYVGSVQLTKSRHTKVHIYSRDVRFDEHIYTDMLFSELPRNTTMLISIYARYYKPTDPHLNGNDSHLYQDFDGSLYFEATQPITSSQANVKITSPQEVDYEDGYMFGSRSRSDYVRDQRDMPLAYASIPLFDHVGTLRSGTIKWPLWSDITKSASPIQTTIPNVCVGEDAYNQPVSWLSFTMDTFALPVVYPSNIDSKPPDCLLPRYNQWQDQKKKQFENEQVEKDIQKIIRYDPLAHLTESDRWKVWNHRHSLKSNPKALTKVLLSCPYQYPHAVQEAHQLLSEWTPPNPIDVLEFLNFNFSDSKVREWAMSELNKMGDNELADFLLQMTQALKYEPYHDSALARFLLQRGLRSTHLIGHILFWSLKSEMESFGIIRERHGLILEEYLRNSGGHRRELMKQNGVVQQLLKIALLIKTTEKEQRVNVLHEQLKKLKKPPKFKLPLSPRMEVNGLLIEKCKVMSSKKLPLWLVFSNADATGAPIYIIFKAGDDLRQDLLTLQLLRVMDKLWKTNAKLDLHMQPYGCVCTGDMVGMIEVVLNSSTVAGIQSTRGGVQAALTSDTPLLDWLTEKNPKKEVLNHCISNFVLSCAGYCSATFVLGIGDRHNDNIMLTQTGNLFHIDFGHFLGHYKTKLGVKRETTPFVFTTMYAHVMGGQKSEEYNR
ncbi:phosphatidylinositol 3-kinase, partial [Acrasis kona]